MPIAFFGAGVAPARHAGLQATPTLISHMVNISRSVRWHKPVTQSALSFQYAARRHGAYVEIHHDTRNRGEEAPYRDVGVVERDVSNREANQDDQRKPLHLLGGAQQQRECSRYDVRGFNAARIVEVVAIDDVPFADRCLVWV